MEYLILSFFILILGAIFQLAFKDSFKIKFCTFISGLSAILSCYPSFKVLFSGNSIGLKIPPSPIFGAINIAIDPLSAFFVVMSSRCA